MNKNTVLKRGEQVAYLPPYADGDFERAEFGFVWEDRGDNVMVRYFYRDNGQMDGRPPLRNWANPESTPKEHLRRHHYVSPDYVRGLIVDIENRSDTSSGSCTNFRKVKW